MGMPPLRIGTDCSGLETPLMALLNLGVVFAHIFACDCDKYVKRTIKSNFPPEKIYDDITTRNNKNTPKDTEGRPVHCRLPLPTIQPSG